MELFRQEYELNLPPNWGKITYERLKRREEIALQLSSAPVSHLPKIQQAIERCSPSDIGPLDTTDVLRSLTEEEQCEVLTAFPHCQTLLLTEWTSLGPKITRCISFTMAPALTELDLSHSHVQATHLEVLLVRCEQLKILKINVCSKFDSSAMSAVARLCANSLTELYAAKCPLLRDEPLLWLGGCMGLNAPKLSKLQVLDLGECPLNDKGLFGITNACKRLRFLNLKDCAAITDKGLVPLITQNKHLQLISLTGCLKITDKSIIALGAHCPRLTSANLARCTLVGDTGVSALARGCAGLQTINLAGLLRLSEACMFTLSQNCPGLLMLNITGCSEISVNGLNALVAGLEYVDTGVTFFGFKPKDKHIERKLDGALHMLYDSVLKAIEKEKRAKEASESARLKALAALEYRSACIIKRYMRAYACRMVYYHKWRNRVRSQGSLLVQRVFRGVLGRRRFRLRFLERQRFLALAPFADKIAKVARGHLSRVRTHRWCGKALRELFLSRIAEARAGVVVRLQCFARQFLARQRIKAWSELVLRRRMNINHAALTIQMRGRMYNAKVRVANVRYMKKRREALERRSAARIQLWYRECMERYFSKLEGKALQSIMRSTWKSAMLIQRQWRGHKGRETIRKQLIQKAGLHHAAISIQKTYRAARVLHWRDMRLNIIAAFVLDRQFIERKDSIVASRLRYKTFVQDNRRDSASDPDDEEEPAIEWVEGFDKIKKRRFWKDPMTKKITYDEPNVPLEHEKSMVGCRVQVYWVVQQQWYRGVITSYHMRKRRHRIEYDDGDHEWINLDEERDRVQVQSDDGSWTTYGLFESSGFRKALIRQRAQHSQDRFKEQAWEDATQWRLISSASVAGGEVLFMSTKTGEMRVGTYDAPLWAVQDDGYGFPCFVKYSDDSEDNNNNVNVEPVVKYEDPRFVHDMDIAVAAERAYVMQELRYALYFCKELYEKYQLALKASKESDETEDDDNDRKSTKIVKSGGKVEKSQGKRGEKSGDQLKWVFLTIANSSKPKHLASFLIRAKVLYQSTSIVDVPQHVTVKQELEYATWLSQQMTDILRFADEWKLQRKQERKETVTKLTTRKKEKLLCVHCKRETRRHLDFCPTCGKKQVNFVVVPLEEAPPGGPPLLPVEEDDDAGTY